MQNSTEKVRERHTEIRNLTREMQQLKCGGEMENNTKQQIEENMKELDEVVAQKARGAMIRATAGWIEKGEKPTKNLFFHLEKRNLQTKTINIPKNNGQKITGQKKIRELN